MRNWAKNTSRAAIVAASAVAVGAGFGSAGAVAHADMRTSGNFGVLNGNQITVPIDVAANVCGVSAAVLGASQAIADCEAEIGKGKGGHHGYDHRSASTDRWNGGRKHDDFDMKTSGNFGIGNGNQVYVPVDVAANVCGVSAGVVGKSRALAKCEAEVEQERRKPDMKTSDNFGIANGNQVYVPVDVALNVCGVSVGVLGASQALGKCEAEIGDGDDHLPHTKRVGHAPAQRQGGTPNPGDVTAGVTSTVEQLTQGAVRRAAGPVAAPVANERSAKAAKAAKPGKVGSAVRRLVGSLGNVASKTGLADVETKTVETSLPLDQMPIGAGAPSVR